MTELQKQLLKIYKEFDRVTKILEVDYYLAYGTMLGAARHNGFIPWDDDMDFFMMRKDYDKLVKEGPSLFKKPFFLQTHETDKNWLWPFMKIRNSNTTAIEFENASFNQGLWIDVFPLDNRVLDAKKNHKDAVLFGRLITRLTLPYKRKRPICIKKHLLNFYVLLKFPNKEIAYKKMIELGTKYKKNHTEFIGTMWGGFLSDTSTFYKSEQFASYHLVKFEDMLSPLIDNYDEHLKLVYGNWKKLPEISDRHSPHTIKYLDLNNPYTLYYENRKTKR